MTKSAPGLYTCGCGCRPLGDRQGPRLRSGQGPAPRKSLVDSRMCRSMLRVSHAVDRAARGNHAVHRDCHHRRAARSDAGSGTDASAGTHPYGLDPYKPSDAAILRTYGGTLVQQTPLLELRQLDPVQAQPRSTAPPDRERHTTVESFLLVPECAGTGAFDAAGHAARDERRQPDRCDAGNVVVILVPPNGQSSVPRISPERPALPIPPLPQPRVPGSAPGGLRKVRLTPEQAAQTLRGLAYDSPTLNASVDNAPQDQPVEP